MKPTIAEIRERAEADLTFFAKLVNPHRVYGAVHEELFNWWTSEEASDNQLCLLPRDHQKSHCAAVKAAWDITRNPWETILYVSATAGLAEKQLLAIKNIIDSKVFRRYWPDLINEEEGKREKWSAMEIAVDHPERKKEGVRDPSVKAAGLTTNITGFHANRIYLDDVVVPLNAYTEEGRRKVESMYSQLASIKTTGSKTIAVGTRYHPVDLYATILERTVDVYEGEELVDRKPLYDIFQKVVEENGEFLWPKQMRNDGRYFGFDNNELAKKRAEYLDTTQFFAQYYNNPNDPGDAKVSSDKFQYYDRSHLEVLEGRWTYKGERLNVFAAIDFAFSLNTKADFTSIVVVGVDQYQNFYILDIDRFKTKSIKTYYDHILSLHQHWGFRKLKAETNSAQDIIVEDLKMNYIRPNGIALSVEGEKSKGDKTERNMAILSPKYDNLQMWHYKGGNCQTLEEELKLKHPPHDDCMDSLGAAVKIAIAPSRSGWSRQRTSKVISHPRFGGVSA